MNLRWKLLVTNLAVALLGIIILGGYMEHSLRDYYVRELEVSLEKSAMLAENLVRGDLASRRIVPTDALAKRLYRQTGYRFTFIDPRGRVLGDAERDPRTMPNHAFRPEVRDALRRGRGIGIRPSGALGTDMLYVAIPVREGDSPVGVIRIAVPLTSIEATLGRMRAAFAAVMLTAILLALLLSANLANRIADPIQELRTKAIRIAAGDLDQKISSDSSDEIGDLARAFGQMATQIKTMLSSATEERNKIRAIFSGMSDGILVVDAAGRITLANDAARAVLRIGEQEVSSGSVIEATRNHEIDAAVSEAERTREPQKAEVRLALPEERILSLLATPVMDDRGELLAIVTLLHDITEIRRLERIRRDFAASASHELRTPIASIRVMAESLIAGAEEDPALRDQFVRAILDSSNRLAALVDDLLTLSALEHPAPRRNREEVAVKELVERVMPLFTARAKARGLDLRVAIPDDLRITGDADLLDHALVNLLDNAIKYTPAGSVEVRAERDGDSVLIHVSDTGSGIPSQHLARIFERFYRVDKARSREVGGTGLGLSIVKHAAEEQGGSVEVQSELGKGSTFTLRIPAG